MRTLLALSVAVGALSTAGCADHYYNHPRLALDNGETTYLDVKQRAVYAQYKTIRQYPWYLASDGRWYQGNAVFELNAVNCPEPPPDALTTLAGSGSGNLSFAQKISLGGSVADSENAESIGLRTQSTELLKQQSTNHCLGYQSGGLTTTDYQMLTFDQQPQNLAYEAIEQLTGVLKSPAGTTVAATQPAAPATPATSDSTDDPPAASDKKKPAKKAKTPAPKAANPPATPATAATTPASNTGQLTDVAEVARAVDDIVYSTLDIGFTRDICSTLILGISSGDIPSNVPAASTCQDYLTASVQRVENVNAMLLNVNDYMRMQIRAGKPISDTSLRYLTMMAVAGSGGRFEDPKAQAPDANGQQARNDPDQIASGHIGNSKALAKAKKPHSPTTHRDKSSPISQVHPTSSPNIGGGRIGGANTFQTYMFICRDGTRAFGRSVADACAKYGGGPAIR